MAAVTSEIIMMNARNETRVDPDPGAVVFGSSVQLELVEPTVVDDGQVVGYWDLHNSSVQLEHASTEKTACRFGVHWLPVQQLHRHSLVLAVVSSDS